MNILSSKLLTSNLFNVPFWALLAIVGCGVFLCDRFYVSIKTTTVMISHYTYFYDLEGKGLSCSKFISFSYQLNTPNGFHLTENTFEDIFNFSPTIFKT
jgi:hypothetical protein